MHLRTKHNIRKILFLIIILMGIPRAYAGTFASTAALAPGYALQHEEFSYAFVLAEGESKPDNISDSLFYHSAKGVIFPVNKYGLPKDDAWLRELEEKVEPWARDNNLELRFIEMRGASSPEGPLWWNDTLAARRSKALQKNLQKIFHVDYNLVDSAVVENPEDYKALLYMMKAEHDPDYELVKGILDKHHGNRVTEKKELKSVQKGQLWRRLLRQYYPRIRYARVLLYFEPMDKVPRRITKVKDPVSLIERHDTLNLMGIHPAEPPQGHLAPITIHYEPDTTELPILPRRHVVALRTNLLYDGLYMPRYGWAPSPDIQMEIFPRRGRFTYNLGLTYPDWEEWPNPQKFWQIHDYKFTARCYLRPRKIPPRDTRPFEHEHVKDYFQGLFVGPYVQAGRYGIGFNKDDGWEGEYVGAGLQIGYTIPISRSSRWRLEFTVSGGALVSKYDPYIWGNPISGDYDGLYYYDWHHSAEYFIKRNHRFTWLGPTEVGINLTYDLLYRKARRRGISFRRWENRR